MEFDGLDGKVVLVTGGSGFIGSALLPLLSAYSRKVISLSRRPGLSATPTAICHVACDILDGPSLASAFDAQRPDIVIHLAGLSLPPKDAAARRAMIDINLTATDMVLAEAARHEVELAVVAGSAAQYGPMEREDRGLREDDPCRPSGLYGITKAAAGALALDFGRTTGLPVTLALPFNVIGPSQAAHFVPATFIQQLADAPGAGAVCLAVGDLDARRDWVDVRDVARALALLAAAKQPGAFNICTGQAVSVSALLEALCTASGRPLEWRSQPQRRRPDLPSVNFGDPAKIRAMTGWRAQIGLATSLTDMLRASGGTFNDAEHRIA